MEKKSSKGLIVVIVILLLAVLGLGGYIVYEKTLNEDTATNEEKVKTEKKENDNSSQDLAIALGKKLYVEARDVAYNICFIGGYYSDMNTCYYSNNGTMTQDETCQKGDIPYYSVNYSKYKDEFTQNGLKQYESFMNNQNAGKFVISNNEYFIRDGIGDCYQGLSEKSTKISIADMSDNKITYNITERYCDLGHFDECEANNSEYLTDINTTFTIVKDNGNWKIEDFNDTYSKYLNQ